MITILQFSMYYVSPLMTLLTLFLPVNDHIVTVSLCHKVTPVLEYELWFLTDVTETHFQSAVSPLD